MTFRFLTSGESHGKCLNAIIEGLPAGVNVSEEFINKHLARRQVGYGRGGRMQIEKDTVKVNSGIRHGITTGAPICFEITNRDWENWLVPMSTSPVDMTDADVQKVIAEKKITKVRPGHADYAGALKYNQEDIRNILERSSARETAARVAVGALAQSVLEEFGIKIFSHVIAIGSAQIDERNPDNYLEIMEKAEASDLRCADDGAYLKMKQEIDSAQEKGDTLGGLIEIVVLDLPIGLGSHVHWDRRLDGVLAQSVMSIPAVKSVEVGLGKDCAYVPGSKVHDEVFSQGKGQYIRKTNNAGGLEGGMTNGEPLVIRAAMKAIPTMRTPLSSIDLESGEEHVAHFERSDTCAVPACGVVAEAMIANVLLNVFLEKFGSDSLAEIRANYENYTSMISKR